MVSAVSAIRLFTIAIPTGLILALFGLTRPATIAWLHGWLTRPGWPWRVGLAMFAAVNWKSVPVGWTFRVLGVLVQHLLVVPRPWPGKPGALGPGSLFHPVITTTYASILECDYNMHKSNSSYFSDLDVSRSNLVTHLLSPAMHVLADNERAGIVLDPRSGGPARGAFAVALGAVQTNFRREIGFMRRYDIWTRVLSWDRKWLYLVSYFVRPGSRPTAYDWTRRLGSGVFAFGRTRRPEDVPPNGWQDHIYAVSITKYVFKLGRLTIHPAVLLEQSGLLPHRPDGWTGGTDGMGRVPLNGDSPDSPLPHISESAENQSLVVGHDEWTWQQTEKMRLKGMELATHFAELDALYGTFDCGQDGALGCSAKLGESLPLLFPEQTPPNFTTPPVQFGFWK